MSRYFELTLRKGNRQAFIDRMTLKPDTTRVSLIKNIEQPTLIFWGEKGFLIPVSNAYLFQKDLPNDTLVILKNLGNVPREKNPTESLLPVRQFLKK